MTELQSISNSASTTSEIRSSTKDCSQQARVMLWCTPRSTSSILTKCLSFVPKSQVFFEPYYFCYEALERLKTLGLHIDPLSMKSASYDDVGMKDWLATANLISGGDCSKEGKPDFEKMKYPRIKELLEDPDPDQDVIFLKEMAYSIDGRYQFLPDKSCRYRHAFLLRHPMKVFASWRKVMMELDLELNGSKPDETETFHVVKDLPALYSPPGLFFKELHDLWLHVKQNYDPNPVVLDSDELLSDPTTVLPRFCKAVGIPYSDDLLKWPKGPDTTNSWISAFSPPNDFDFLRIYCRTAFNTTHFLPPSPLPCMDNLTEDVEECVNSVMPYYQEMYNSRM